jgi:hypothetical protein
MSKQPSHAYVEQLAFARLMLLIATFLRYPGVGYLQVNDDEPHNALAEVQQYLQTLATECGITLPPDYPSIPTLRKDLENLRRYGILEPRMYRWGYYLGTGVMSKAELQVAFNALASQAKFQGDAPMRRIYESLHQRLRGLDLDLGGEFFYPVRQHLNRTIVYTDPEEMAEKGENQDTLFHQLPCLETAIIQGQIIEISRSSDFYGNSRVGPIQVYPLQLVYHDIAWYLLRTYATGTFKKARSCALAPIILEINVKNITAKDLTLRVHFNGLMLLDWDLQSQASMGEVR